MIASKRMQKYFEELEKSCLKAQKIAVEARKQGYDPENVPEISLAKNMAERVIGLISIAAPQIRNSGADKRIIELEKEYGILDWRVAFKIAEEIAKETFCKFEDQKEAIEVGIRTGFAYATVGVVSSPLEGFTTLELKDRLDGKGKYFCLNFSGPIRNAGGTAASVCVLIADYLRKTFGFEKYDPTEKEILRCYTEIEDYHNFVTNLQYFPSSAETEFLMKNLPVEISGDPSEKWEVSNYKDLPRIPTNKLRSGYCLIHSSCIPLKAPKLWKNLVKWGHDFNMEDWDFMEEFLKVQKKAKAEGKKGESSKISPDYTYIKDLVAGRPVIGYPLRSGGLRLRYGRSRTSGYSGNSIHPSTMHVLNDFFATATQLKVERPGKATSLTCCDSLEGPLVKLKNGDVIQLNSESLAKKHKKDVAEIIYLGDMLVNYGDFFNRFHVLVPPGYCEEYWILEAEEAIIKLFGTLDFDKTSELVNISRENLEILFNKPINTNISAKAALNMSKTLGIPLSPKYTYHWKSIGKQQLMSLLEWLERASIIKEEQKIVKTILPKSETKRVLEVLGVPHLFVNQEYILIDANHSTALFASLGINEKKDIYKTKSNFDSKKSEDVLELVNKVSYVKIKDKSGVFIGARMGRPEKAKMRKLTGSPHVLFPVGSEGGVMRSFQAALDEGKITADFPVYYCKNCQKETIYGVCEICGKQTDKKKHCSECGIIDSCHHEEEGIDTMYSKVKNYKNQTLDIRTYFDHAMKHLGETIYPDLIKGVRGTSSKDHIPENLAKGILRAKNSLHVNKDGTIRYDSSEVTLTHFKPKEIGTSVEKLKNLGYEKDIYGQDLETTEQILELKPQDVVLPACLESPDEPCDEILFRTTKFIDELLEKFYKLQSFYNLKSKADLIGQLIIGLAPHTSAGILGRIIGFSRNQGYMAHPFFHAAMRRDVDGDESCIFLLMDGFLNFSKHYLPSSRGSTMDTPIVLTYMLNPTEVDDMAFDVDRVWRYPLEFYRACEQFKLPIDVKIERIKHVLDTPEQFEGMGFTHHTSDFNKGVFCSQYKLLPSMQEKLQGQMDLAVKLRCVDEADVARLVIEKHFLRDIKGNFRKFSQQQFRCVKCNEKFRRPPLSGNCTKCTGNIIFTISEGSILKYLEPSLNMAKAFNIPIYLKQTLELTKRQIESYFGKDPERQEGLGKWFEE